MSLGNDDTAAFWSVWLRHYVRRRHRPARLRVRSSPPAWVCGSGPGRAAQRGRGVPAQGTCPCPGHLHPTLPHARLLLILVSYERRPHCILCGATLRAEQRQGRGAQAERGLWRKHIMSSLGSAVLLTRHSQTEKKKIRWIYI